MLANGNISAPDLDLIVVTDSPEKIRDLVMDSMVENGWCERKEAAAREETRKAYQGSDS
jgi:hypothetical protein